MVAVTAEVVAVVVVVEVYVSADSQYNCAPQRIFVLYL